MLPEGASVDGNLEIIQRHARPTEIIGERPRCRPSRCHRARFAKTTDSPDAVLAWINSADFNLVGALENVANYFTRHPEFDVLYGHHIVVNEE